MNLYDRTFRFGGHEYRYFYHAYNCGFPVIPRRCERTVELALADYWMTQANDVWEVGAVTPYYWPGRAAEIFDPFDKNELVTIRQSMFDFSFRGRDVLSVSTIEHIGSVKYAPEGTPENHTGIDALVKLLTESRVCLVTFGIGQNEDLDKFVLANEVMGARFRFMARNMDESWSEINQNMAYRTYGSPDQVQDWANSVAIIEKGGIL